MRRGWELGLFRLEKRRLRVILLITVYKYLVWGSKDDGGRLFSVVASDKAQGIVHELKYRKFHLIIKRYFLCVCVYVTGQPLEQVSQRGYGASIFGDAQKWVGCGPVQSGFDDFALSWGDSWGWMGNRGGNCGLNRQRLSLPTSMIMWNWEQKALLSFSSLCFSVAWVTTDPTKDQTLLCVRSCSFLLRIASTVFS